MVRMISVTDTVYEKLKTRKREKSFSKLFEELLEEKNQRILRFAGALKDEWKGRDAKKWVQSIRNEDKKAEQKRWKEIEKHWKG